MSASLKHILLSFEEYERLKHIESEYHKLQSNTQQNLQDKSQFKEIEKDKLDNLDSYQSGSGVAKTSISNDEEFVNRIALLVTKKIHPRLPETIWNNFNLSEPNTAMTTQPNTLPPLHYDNVMEKNDENDVYGKLEC